MLKRDQQAHFLTVALVSDSVDAVLLVGTDQQANLHSFQAVQGDEKVCCFLPTQRTVYQIVSTIILAFTVHGVRLIFAALLLKSDEICVAQGRHATELPGTYQLRSQLRSKLFFGSSRAASCARNAWLQRQGFLPRTLLSVPLRASFDLLAEKGRCSPTFIN